jgi:cellulose synthase/poly-beta-1,6-N-acetylglucosamine synthase-like glycosyltransferase
VIGVIVPVRGFAPYLAETLDCVLAQEGVRSGFEVVVVDDASLLALELHPDHAPHCTLVRRETCGGPAAARETGLAAFGDCVSLVAICDADDAWLPGKLAAQAAAFAREPDAVACFTRALVVGADGRATGERWVELAPGLHAGGALTTLLYESNPIPTSSMMLRRAALEEAGGFTSPVRVAADWDLWLRLAARGGGFICLDETLVRHRRHPGRLATDVEGLARCQLELHRAHGALVTPHVRQRALAADTAAVRAVRRTALRALVSKRDPYRR